MVVSLKHVHLTGVSQDGLINLQTIECPDNHSDWNLTRMRLNWSKLLWGRGPGTRGQITHAPIFTWRIYVQKCRESIKNGYIGYPTTGFRSSYPVLDLRRPKNCSTSSTSSYLKSCHYDHGYFIYGLFNQVDLLMPHVHVLKKQRYCLMCA